MSESSSEGKRRAAAADAAEQAAAKRQKLESDEQVFEFGTLQLRWHDCFRLLACPERSVRTFSDLEITVGKASFRVHKAVLSQHSTVFATMLTTDLSVSKLDLTGKHEHSCFAFHALMAELYSGRFGGAHASAAASCML